MIRLGAGVTDEHEQGADGLLLGGGPGFQFRGGIRGFFRRGALVWVTLSIRAWSVSTMSRK